jgi:hypothetical protein
MPKRVIDGEAVWSSEKLLRVSPRFRCEFVWILPNALANGVCEIDARRIWSRCYAYCREDYHFADVEQMLDEFESAGMLFRWTIDGKRWGFFVGIDKSGRLPGLKRLEKKHDAIGPTPPADELAEYLRKHCNGKPMADHSPADGVLGSGLGSGSGSGSGIGTGNRTSAPLAASPKQGAARRGSRVPEDFTVSNAHRQFAAAKGLPDPEDQVDAFIDYWRAQSGSRGIKLDWDATFRTWLRRARPSIATTAKNASFIQMVDSL